MSRPSLFVLPEHVRDQDYALATSWIRRWMW